MERSKVERHLMYAREHLEFLREEYVRTVKDPARKRLNSCTVLGSNPYKERVQSIREDMKETKARIAKFERVLL